MSKPTKTDTSLTVDSGPWAGKLCLTVQEAADMLRIPKRTLHQHIAQGKYAGTHVKHGKRRVFHRDRLLRAFFGEV